MEHETEAPKPQKAPKHRSPSYPAIDLPKALERTKQLAAVAGRHAAPISAALGEWGYSPKSSAGLLTIAAVKKFGLVADEGKQPARQLRLTQLGQELVFYDSDRESDVWVQRAQEAALKPSIHRELWDKYQGHLPGDSVIRPYLVLQRGFSDSAAREVLRILRSTVRFAKMSPGDSVGNVSVDEPDTDQNTDQDEVMTPAAIGDPPATPKPVEPQDPPAIPAAKPQKQPQRTVQVPYSPGEWALVQAAFPMTDAAWKQMIAVLEAMKPGLVASDE
jgi:hypothetical protein